MRTPITILGLLALSLSSHFAEATQADDTTVAIKAKNPRFTLHREAYLIRQQSGCSGASSVFDHAKGWFGDPAALSDLLPRATLVAAGL
ncbi:MAG: hypothetical protein H0T11_09000 [Chthoniobacterales bacterium]|nr:hypothetical protein [Chthoniobacterales bacterium]